MPLVDWALLLEREVDLALQAALAHCIQAVLVGVVVQPGLLLVAETIKILLLAAVVEVGLMQALLRQAQVAVAR